MPGLWDYLIITATNDLQAAAYESQLETRQALGQLTTVRQTMVIPDLQGRRIGSGGSTIECLRRVVSQERLAGPGQTISEVLAGLRILIVHAGGDSRRLPTYSPCGKLFIPLPGANNGSSGETIFDRLVPQFLAFPTGGKGQVVVATGDALLNIDSSQLVLNQPGMTALGGWASPEEAARHGVYCANDEGRVRLYLQKPSPEAQRAAGALNQLGEAVLDLGVMSLDGPTAASLLKICCTEVGSRADLEWIPSIKDAVLSCGIDLYREICCALGTEGSYQHYLNEVRGSGGKMIETLLLRLYEGLKDLPLNLQVLDDATFLHFGSTRELISSGIALVTKDSARMPDSTVLSIDNYLGGNGAIEGADGWVEGCRVLHSLRLQGRNVVTGADIVSPLSLSTGACVDVAHGTNHSGDEVRFVRCYGIDDTFKHTAEKGGTFCGMGLDKWMCAVGASPLDLWSASDAVEDRTLWNARVFPAIAATGDPEPYRQWLWFFHVEGASPEERALFLQADRYSTAEIASLIDQPAFYARRSFTRADDVESKLPVLFSRKSPFSHRQLALALARSSRPSQMLAGMFKLAHSRVQSQNRASIGGIPEFEFSRVIHSLGSALKQFENEQGALACSQLISGITPHLPSETQDWMESAGFAIPEPPESAEFSLQASGSTVQVLEVATETQVARWADTLQDLAFEQLNQSILRSSMRQAQRPRNALRPDETIWGRSPARIELAGGWTDTPPYTLERGGEVANTAINLCGQPPIHCYCRVTREPVICVNSIDGGERIVIRELEELLDYRRPGDPFALAKAALAISGFSPETGGWPEGIALEQMLTEFGGGIDLTTLVGIPQGSGLGTSSILGATILGVIARMLGVPMNQQELFHNVLRLEQALTTGGGWQDQVGGCVGGSKIASTQPSMFPFAHIHYLPSDVLDPKRNGGCTLLYYTGLTRIAKGILREIVGGYLNREPAILEALSEEHLAARHMADVMASKDIGGFGASLDAAWALQKRLCKTVTNPAIDSLLERVRPFVHGMRISGAGSGGFLLMVAKSQADAQRIREMLEREPLNDRSRFFDFEVNERGLEVTTC